MARHMQTRFFSRSAACRLVAILSWLACACAHAGAPEPWVTNQRHPGDFVLADAKHSAGIIVADKDARVVGIAARDLAADIEQVTGRRPAVGDQPARTAVIIGTLGRSPLVDRLAASGKLAAGQLKGAWESFLIATVDKPLPGVDRALVIAGSDARGTAFGVYELSQAIGVSPWHWWADVAPEHKDGLYVAPGLRRFGPPSVKYRGIFINDEDWGMQRWAGETYEPEYGSLGPKTYRKVFELLLRLKANTLWPAMHPTTKAFNADPRNAALAGDYAIVMGSSHAEPMLRNNVSEWTEPADHFNYATHPDTVLDYWRARIDANKQYENMYTIGMRGIHDGRMQGPKDDAARIALMEKIFADQRALLPPGSLQVFTPYKEVLPLYDQGLKVPDDVTIIWPDDNFGYIRRFPNDAERRRGGGAGVYYHLSYLGAPLSYIWLYTTPPALVWEEMSRAYDQGARTVWIANVGDIKPAEAGMEFFLQMAWDIHRWNRTTLPDYLPQWAAREFGPRYAGETGAIMNDYFRLNFDRKPEHLQWWLPKTSPHPSSLSPDESRARLRAAASLRARVEGLQAGIPPAKQDAWFELVAYPVIAAALANERYFEGELGDVDKATQADTQLHALTARWDTSLAGGKWRHMMAEEPADEQWKSFRIARWTPQLAAQAAAGARPLQTPAPLIRLEAEAYASQRAGGGARWELIPGLGHTGRGSVALFPTTTASFSQERLAGDAPRLDYALDFSAPGRYRLDVNLLPTHPLAGKALRFAVGLDGEAPQIVSLPVKDDSPEWAQGVLDARRTAAATLTVAKAGKRTLNIYAVDAGVVLDSLSISAE
jgi:hypothetical protein